jgi:hypothetical protein
MSIDETRGRPRRSRGGALQAATFIALVAGCGASAADHADASASGPAAVAQNASADPCRFSTAEAVGSAFGRPLKSSKLVNACEYRGTGTDLVIVKVAEGAEGTILRHAKAASAQRDSGAEKVTTAVGEAYFDSVLPAFIGRVGNHEVQIETTIQPVPREAMIAVGLRIMETFARK